VGISSGASSAYGGGGIPHAYLVDPDGVVTWEGHPASLNDGTIEKLLRKTTDFYLRKVDDALKPAAAAFKKGKLGEAEKLATEVRDGDAGREAKADAEYVLGRVAAQRDFWNGRVTKGTEAGLYEEVFDALEDLEKSFAGTEVATDAAAKLKELKADPAVKNELSLTKKLQRLKGDFQEAGSNEKKLDALEKKVQKFVDKNGDTKAGKRAGMLLEAVRKAPRK